MEQYKKEDKMQQIFANLDKGIKEVFSSDKYINYLKTMSKFHNYSPNNTILIFSQCPDASYVAGYKSWKKNFKRYVKRGEKGIQIIGFNPVTIETEEKIKDERGNYVVGLDGEFETEIVKKKLPKFKPMYVFDISQTEGEELPKLVKELSGNVNNYSEIMNALVNISPYPICYENIDKDGVKGYCDYGNGKIVIKHMMSEEQRIKTCIHEISHAMLHVPSLESGDENKSHNIKEIEAESSAYIICNYYGIDTSDYSFGYVASWSEDKNLTELHECLDTIQKHSMKVINEIDSYFEKDMERNIDTLELNQASVEAKMEYDNEKLKNSIKNSKYKKISMNQKLNKDYEPEM